MRKTALIMAGAALCALAPTAAMAQSTLTGMLSVQKGTGPELECFAEIDIDGDTPETSTQVTGISLTGGLLGFCASVQFPSVPDDIVQGGGSFTVEDVYADTTITEGDCEGDLVGSVSGGVVTLNTTLPEVTGGGDCTINGSVS